MNDGKTLYIDLAIGLGNLTAGLAKGAAQITTFGSRVDAEMAKLEKWGSRNEKQLHSLGTGFGAFGIAAAAGLGYAIHKAAEFDAAMSSVQAATHASVEEMSLLRKEALKQGADTAFSATEAAQGIEELAKAGIQTTDILDGGLAGALSLAAAGNLDVATAAEIAATAITQFRMNGESVPHLADLLAAGAGKAQGEVTDLGAALQQSGLVASNMGLSIEDTTGSLAAFAAAGMAGSDSGTSFKTMLQRLQAPLGQSKKAFEEYGISAYDAQGNFVGITNVAEQLQTKLGGLDQATRDAALTQMFGADAIRAATVLYREGGDGIQSWIDKTNDAGYAAETARLKTDNLAGDLERLGGSLDTFFINLGSGGQGPARELVQMLEAIVDAGGQIPAPLMSSAAAALALSAAFGGSVWAATRMIGAVGQTRANVAFLRAEVQRATTAITTMNRAQLGVRVGKGAATMAGLALATSGVADEFGLANTASLALMGTWAGPLGTTAGAAVGFLLDVAGASDDVREAFAAAQKTLSEQTRFQGQIDALEELKKATVDYYDVAAFDMGAIKEGFRDLFGKSTVEQQADDLRKAEDAVHRYQGALQMLEDRTVGAGDGVNELFDVRKMQAFADRAGPILEKVGIDLDTVLKEGPDGENWGAAVAAISEYAANSDTAAGRSEVLGDAVAGLDDEMATAADSASGLAAALDGLLSPNLDLDRATIAWRESLRGLKKELADGSRELVGNSEAADQNRTAVMQSVDSLQKRLEAAAASGSSAAQITNMLSGGRQALIDTAVAAGLTAEQMEQLLDLYGLTPDLVSTLIEAQGADAAKNDIDSVGDAADNLGNKTATPSVRPVGTGRAMNEISNVDGAVTGLSGKTGRPGVQLGGVPVALLGADSVATRLAALSKKRATPSVQVGGLTGALRGLSDLGAKLAALDGKHSSSTVTTIHRNQTVDAYGSFRPGRGQGIPPRMAYGAYSAPMQAHISRAGRPRGVYSEPETQGESYIPHAKDRRRRATQILALTADRFGYDLSPRGRDAAPSGSGGSTTVIHQQAPLFAGPVAIGGGDPAQTRQNFREVDKYARRKRRGGVAR